MKYLKLTMILLIAVLLLTACGAEKEEQDPLVSVYLNSAQTQIDKGEYDTAIKILEEGIAALGENETLSQKLLEIEALMGSDPASENETEADQTQGAETTQPSSEIDLSPYFGTWAEEGVHWTGDSMITDIYLEKGKVFCELTYTQAAPQSRIASTVVEITGENVENNIFTGTFENDGWGNEGTVSLAFLGEEMTVTFSQLVNTGEFTPSWGFYETTFSLIRDDSAHDKLSYTMDMYNAHQRLENQYSDDTDYSGGENQLGSGYFDLGGIRYDDIAGMLPVSMDQIMNDLVLEEINYDYVNQVKTPCEILGVIPVKARPSTKKVSDKYDVFCYGFFSLGDTLYEKKFRITYRYYEIGGWVLDGGSGIDTVEHSISAGATAFEQRGKKLGNFGYYDYASGCPLSMGEIADDILYANLNIFEVAGEEQVFDISSLQILKGQTRESEYQSHLELLVRVNFTNEVYDGTFDLEMNYEYYTLGGWELQYDHTDSDFTAIERSDSYEITPKEVHYDDSEFMRRSKAIFDRCTLVSTEDVRDENGELIRVLRYQGVRDKAYLKEYYDVVLTAKFGYSTWRESLTIDMVEADYSDFLGTWIYQQGEEYIRLTITDFTLSHDPGQASAYKETTATVTYNYETSAWGTSPYQTGTITEEVDIHAAYFTLKDKDYVFYWHESPILSIWEYKGTGSSSTDVNIKLVPSQGVLISVGSSYGDEGKMTRVSP